MEQKSRPKMVRVTVYLTEAQHRKLKSVLALEGISVSEWFRQRITKKLS